MASVALTAGPGFLLLAAWLYSLGGAAALTAFCTAALAHELGHLAALRLCGARVTGLRLTAAGPVIEYTGALDRGQEALVAAAGPVAGLLLAALCALLHTPYFQYAGLLALLSSMFNLLPALPLDGGRLAEIALYSALPARAASVVLRVSGVLCAAAVAAVGAASRAPAAAALGIWLAALAIFPRLR